MAMLITQNIYDRPPIGTTRTISGLQPDDFDVFTVKMTMVFCGGVDLEVQAKKKLISLVTVRRPCHGQRLRSLQP